MDLPASIISTPSTEHMLLTDSDNNNEINSSINENCDFNEVDDLIEFNSNEFDTNSNSSEQKLEENHQNMSNVDESDKNSIDDQLQETYDEQCTQEEEALTNKQSISTEKNVEPIDCTGSNENLSNDDDIINDEEEPIFSFLGKANEIVR